MLTNFANGIAQALTFAECASEMREDMASLHRESVQCDTFPIINKRLMKRSQVGHMANSRPLSCLTYV